jgi:A/G-specific adenine glycosylase
VPPARDLGARDLPGVPDAQPGAPAELLAWFDRYRRDLPWRRTTDPYRIWLSEVMLQQTRVETALPYYQRFLERFPSVAELGRAPVEEVLALWSGLGYYRRARQLHAAARQIGAGEFPRRAAELRQLPGIGPYTAAAVASIAFGEAVAVLDGNVERVMGRWLALAEDPKGVRARARLLAAASALLEPSRPGDSNQALMELGATLCLPRRPRCLLCPLRPGCRAAAEGRPERYPLPRRRRLAERRRLLVAVAVKGERVLLFRRPARSGLLAGTWELPWIELGEAEEPGPQGLAEKYGGAWRLGAPVATVRHGITYRDLRVTVCPAELLAGAADEVREAVESGWFDAGERSALPASSLVGKVLRACGDAAGGAGAGGGAVSLEPVQAGCRARRPASRSRSRRPG